MSAPLVEFAPSEVVRSIAVQASLVASFIATTCHLTCLARRATSRTEQSVVRLAGCPFGAAAVSGVPGFSSLAPVTLCAAFASNAHLTLYRSRRG